MRDGGGDVSVVTTLTVVVLVVATLTVPPAVDLLRDDPEQTNVGLTAENATVLGNISLQRSDFGGGTYHFSELEVQLQGVRGVGTLVLKVVVPQLNSYVLTREVPLDEEKPRDVIVRYQPSDEFHPEEIGRDRYLAKVTVRLRSDGTSTVVAEKGFEMEVRG